MLVVGVGNKLAVVAPLQRPAVLDEKVHIQSRRRLRLVRPNHNRRLDKRSVLRRVSNHHALEHWQLKSKLTLLLTESSS
jgi:hypothetical protein